jgi:hypothetical protein
VRNFVSLRRAQEDQSSSGSGSQFSQRFFFFVSYLRFECRVEKARLWRMFVDAIITTGFDVICLIIEVVNFLEQID